MLPEWFLFSLERQLDIAVEEIKMLKTQGLAQKLALLKHNMELQADKLGSRVDAVADKSTQTFARSHEFLDGAESDVAEVEKFIADLGAVTNGGPALKPHPAMTDPEHTTRDSTGQLIHKP